MNSQTTHKIVVGVALAVVVGVGVTMFAIRAKQESDIARVSAPRVPATQTATPETPANGTAVGMNGTAAGTDGTAVGMNGTPAGTDATAAGQAAGPQTAGSDSQITAEVKSQIAAAAPNSNVNVMTTGGVVALAGSVPNQDVAEQAKQAALRVAGVTRVDASGLTVSNR